MAVHDAYTGTPTPVTPGYVSWQVTASLIANLGELVAKLLGNDFTAGLIEVSGPLSTLSTVRSGKKARIALAVAPAYS